MTTQLEMAQKSAADALAKVEALKRVPEEEDYPIDTIVRWRARGDMAHLKTYVAIKVTPSTWNISGMNSDTFGKWPYIVQAYLSKPLAFFEVAPSDWSDARLKVEQPPPIAVEENGFVLFDEHTLIRWERHGNEWVRA